jgi:hypothetical protein
MPVTRKMPACGSIITEPAVGQKEKKRKEVIVV